MGTDLFGFLMFYFYHSTKKVPVFANPRKIRIATPPGWDASSLKVTP